uniref:Si:dkey-42l23.4 n=1 Tax=Myripristis murdjan TaxID=586833 RepID=A0A667ZGS2_9TELE
FFFFFFKDKIGLSNMQIITVVIFFVIFVVGTVGNGLVIYVTGFRMKKTVNSVWFLNLALADFLFTAFLIFMIIYVARGYNWPFGNIMCKLNNLVSVVNMFASIFLLVAISLDRCLSTWVVVWAQNKRTPGKAQIACILIWLTALACSIPFAIARQTVELPGRIICTYSESMDKRSYNIFRFVVGFSIPFLTITGSYVAIGVRARRLQRGKKRKSLRIIISIVLAFFMCWLPFHISELIQWDLLSPSVLPFRQIAVPLAIHLAFLNSCLNPILYVFMCDEFQKKLKQSICLVLESALAEDRMSFVSSRSMSWQLSRVSRKSDSGPSIERKGTSSSLATTNSSGHHI